MKKSYVKPSVSFVELRLEERIAACKVWTGNTNQETYPCVYDWSGAES